MASFTSSFALAIMFIIGHITAVPIRVDEETFNLNENVRVEDQNELISQRDLLRIKRDVQTKCDSFYLAKVPSCSDKAAKFNTKLNKCLRKQCEVPGMPDGEKGHFYYALGNVLYKVFEVKYVQILQPCPTTSTPAAAVLKTTPSSQSSTKTTHSTTNPAATTNRPTTAKSTVKLTSSAQATTSTATAKGATTQSSKSNISVNLLNTGASTKPATNGKTTSSPTTSSSKSIPQTTLTAK